MPILIIHCGGTLGMIKSDLGLVTESGHLNQLLQKSSKLSNFTFDIYELDLIIDSSIATTHDWLNIIDIIKCHYDKYDGYVIIHGTDTMAYASSFISYMVNIDKAIVFTGSTVPMCVDYESAEINILDSLKVAGRMKCGVYLQFGSILFNGDRVTKVSTTNREAFIGHYYPSPVVSNLKKVFYDKHSTDIGIVKIYPNMKNEILLCTLRNTNYVIIETYGTGNGLDSNKVILDVMKRMIDSGGIMINVSQCHGTCVDWSYSSSRGLANAGVMCGKRVTTEAAYALLSYVIGNFEEKLRREKVLECLDLYD